MACPAHTESSTGCAGCFASARCEGGAFVMSRADDEGYDLFIASRELNEAANAFLAKPARECEG